MLTLAYNPLLQLLLEGGDGVAGPEDDWDRVVVLGPPAWVAALSERCFGFESLPIPDASFGFLPCLLCFCKNTFLIRIDQALIIDKWGHPSRPPPSQTSCLPCWCHYSFVLNLRLWNLCVFLFIKLMTTLFSQSRILLGGFDF